MILWIACFTILISTINSLNYSTNSTTNSTRVSVAKIPGDFKIGFLVSVRLHSPGKKNTRNLECGKIREHYGIQRVEVIFQTIDKINKDPNLLKNIKLGVEIRDTCWYAPIALQQTIDLIQDSITPYGKNAAAHNNRQCANSSASESTPLIAVAGPASSSIALQVQNLLQLFSIPQIGYSTTSKDLSDKVRFSTFMRVVPSDYYQAQVMIDIVKYNNWTYIHTVHTDENYGQSGIQAFRELADKSGICIAREDSILSNDDEEKFQELMNNLKEDENANVIVCFCEGMTIRGMLTAIKFLNLTNRFLIIGTEGWADRQDVVSEYEMQAVGSISIRIHSEPVKSFNEYYFKRDPFNNARNVWFREFWEDKFHCKMPATRINNETPTTSTLINEIDLQTSNTTVNDFDYTSLTPLALPSAVKQTPFCTGHEDISYNHKQEPKLNFLIKAIYTLAYGLQSYHENVCGKDFVGVCPQLQKSFNHSAFFNYLMNVSFTTDETDEKENVLFNQDGDVLAHYDIMNFQRAKNGSFYYEKIGHWKNHSLNFTNLFKPPGSGADGEGFKFSSVCSKPCQLGFYKLYQVTGSGADPSYCCWMCVECEENEFLINETRCENCAKGSWPNDNKTGCVENPIDILKWTDTESVIATGFSVLGTSLSAIVLIIFIRFNNTPVVKASTRELCYIVLVGMILSHISVFAILAHPNEEMCLLSRILPGVSFAMIYGSLLVKTNRIARLLAISKKRFPSKKLKFMSPISQVIIALILISIEILIAVTILIIEPPTTELKYPKNRINLLVCKESPTTIIVPLGFIFLIIILCTYNAFKTRNVPENFNETKFVGFAIYTTCVIWIAFFPIYYGSAMQIITKCLCISLSSIMTLIFMFFPKIYIILLHPEKNIRALFTTSKSIRCHIGATRHSNISNKNSSSISSVHGQSSMDYEQTLQRTRSLKKSSSCQTSTEFLSVFKVDASCSPVGEDNFEFSFPEHTYLEHYPHEILSSPYNLLKHADYRRIPSSPGRSLRLRKDKIFVKDSSAPIMNGNGRLHHPMKPHRTKNKHKKKTIPVLCSDCLEVERQNVKNFLLLPKKMEAEKKSPIFTVEKIPMQNITPTDNSMMSNDKKKIAISEESLSECSIEDSTSYKLKRITIQLK